MDAGPDIVSLAHLRGQCISELGVPKFSRAYQQAKSAAAVAGAAEGAGAGAGGNGVDITGVVDVKILGEGKGHLAPLLEMLVLLEGLQL